MADQIRGGIVSRYRRCSCPGHRWDHDYTRLRLDVAHTTPNKD